MKVRIPGRVRVLNPLAREAVRALFSNCAKQTLIEVFDFGGGGEKLRRLSECVDSILVTADESGKPLDYMQEILREHKVQLGDRPGSGEKVLVGREHDIAFGAWLYALVTLEHFRGVRLNRFQNEVCARVRYYNRVFEGTPDVVNDVLRDRLARYRCTDAKELPAHGGVRR